LLTIAEIAVAFAGFASLVSVLGSTSSHEHPLVQSIRFRGMVVLSLTVLAFSLVPFVPMSLGVSPLTSWRISSALFLVGGVSSLFAGLRQISTARAAGVSPVRGTAVRRAVVFGSEGVALLLLGSNVLGFTAAVAAGVYLTALLLFLLGAGIMFVTLLFSFIHPVRSEPPAA
jgi:hypothetical protein